MIDRVDVPRLIDGPEETSIVVALAHGAGQPMDSPFMTFFAHGLATAGCRVVRFEFPYMAERRRTGICRPPDRRDVLTATWKAIIGEMDPSHLVIGGKSLGGRMATMVADEAGVSAVVCLGYPFHPPGDAARTRIDHLATLRTPTLVVQGTRDPFGNRDEVAGYPLSPMIRFHWLAGCDHGFVRRDGSRRTQREPWQDALTAVVAFARALATKAD